MVFCTLVALLVVTLLLSSVLECVPSVCPHLALRADVRLRVSADTYVTQPATVTPM